MNNKKINYTFFILLMINSFIYIAISLYSPFLSSYYSLKGINAAHIGILLTIGPIISILVQPLWAKLSDNTGKGKLVAMIVVTGCSLSILLYYLGSTYITFLFATTVVTSFTTSVLPLCDSIVIRNANKNNLDFAKIRMGGTIGYAIVVVIAGNFLKAHPSYLFLMAFFGYQSLLFFISLLPKSENQLPIAKKEKKEKNFFSLKSIFKDNQIYFVLLFSLICQIGLSFYSGFLGVYVVKAGYGQREIGLLSCISALSEIPVLLVIGRILKKTGAIKIIIFSSIMVSLRILIITNEGFYAFIIGQMMQGLTYMTVHFSCAMFIANNVKEGKYSQGQGILTMMQSGIASIIGSSLGGYLIELIGIKQAYLSASITVFVSAVFLILLFIRYERVQVRNARLKCMEEKQYL